MIFTKKFDIHSIVHFLGCYGLVFTFASFGYSLIDASLLTAVLAVIWELFDELSYSQNWNLNFFDKRGSDILDILVDFTGIILAYIVY